MADKTPTPAANPKTAAIIGIVLAVIMAVMVFAPAWAPMLKPFCQAFGGCADPATVQLP